ncbi:MAG: phosphocholine cytidylyltransferase family protein [candidate division NC10 bacterium]
MRALVLAAGQAIRLRPFTEETPKCLLEMGGKPILAHLLDALAGQGIEDAVVVTGYLGEQIRTFARELSVPVTVVENPRYAETNNLTSVWVAREALLGSAFVILYADILFDPDILKGCLAGPGEICLAVSRELYDESKKVQTQGTRVLAVSKTVPLAEVTGTFLGIARFSKHGGRLLYAEIEYLVREQATDQYYTAAVERLIAKGVPVHCSVTTGLPWVDIDGPPELRRAQEEILPKIAATHFSR